MPSAAKSPLEQPLAELPGVGRDRAEQLARLKLTTIGDVLWQRPRRYEDRRNFQSIQELTLEEPQLCRGTVITRGVKRFRGGRRARRRTSTTC